MTNEHIISKDLINNNIIISDGTELTLAQIKLDENERYLKTFI